MTGILRRNIHNGGTRSCSGNSSIIANSNFMSYRTVFIARRGTLRHCAFVMARPVDLCACADFIDFVVCSPTPVTGRSINLLCVHVTGRNINLLCVHRHLLRGDPYKLSFYVAIFCRL